MKTKIKLDPKSLMIGAAAMAVCIFATGALGGGQAPGYAGHFAVSVGGNGSAAVINTVTGQVWTAHITESNGQAVGTSGPNTFLTKKED